MAKIKSSKATPEKNTSVKKVISKKMQCLNDFNICGKNDADMIAKLQKIIDENPGKDPQRVLDYYCRPMIQAMVNSWE